MAKWPDGYMVIDDPAVIEAMDVIRGAVSVPDTQRQDRLRHSWALLRSAMDQAEQRSLALGTPISELSSQPGDPKNLDDTRNAGYFPKPDFLTPAWKSATSEERRFALALVVALDRADPMAFIGEGPATDERVTIDGNFDLLAVARLMLSLDFRPR